MFLLFLSPVQFLHRGNVLQNLTESTIFPSNNNVRPQHSHRTLSAICQTCAKACKATSSVFLYSLFTSPSPLLFPLQSFFSTRTQHSPDKRVCRRPAVIEPSRLLSFSLATVTFYNNNTYLVLPLPKGIYTARQPLTKEEKKPFLGDYK